MKCGANVMSKCQAYLLLVTLTVLTVFLSSLLSFITRFLSFSEGDWTVHIQFFFYINIGWLVRNDQHTGEIVKRITW